MSEKDSAKVPAHFLGGPPREVVPSNPSDVCELSAIITALYESISGPAGQPRDWQRFRSLFLPEALSVRVASLPDNRTGYLAMNTAEYIAQTDAWLVQNGFFETEIHQVVERYRDIAHVFSTYESRHSLDEPHPFMRGLNSFHLLYDGHRWWIAHAIWQHESSDHPIPARFLP